MEESEVRDGEGKLKVVLHGTPNDDFYEFSEDKIGSTTDAGWLGRGFYFYGNNPEYARQYAKGGRVIEAYLDIRNPYYATSEDMERLAEANDPEESRRFREELEATVEAVKSGKAMPIPFEEILNVTKTTFAVLKAVKSGGSEIV